MTGEGLKFLTKEEAESLERIPEPSVSEPTKEEPVAAVESNSDAAATPAPSIPTENGESKVNAESAAKDDWQPRRRKTNSLLRYPLLVFPLQWWPMMS